MGDVVLDSVAGVDGHFPCWVACGWRGIGGGGAGLSGHGSEDADVRDFIEFLDWAAEGMFAVAVREGFGEEGIPCGFEVREVDAVLRSFRSGEAWLHRG